MRTKYYAKITKERGALRAALLKPESPPLENVVFEVILPPLSAMRMVAFYDIPHARTLEDATKRMNEIRAEVTLAEGDA
jgi:hypothetical protein